MRKTIVSLIFGLLLPSMIFAQESQADELQNLQKQIAVLLAQGKHDDVILNAEKIVEIEKQGGEKNLVNYSSALMNLALWKKQRLSQSLAAKNVTPTFKGKVTKTDVEEIRETKSFFEELLKIFQTRLDDAQQLAAVQSELAVMYCTFPEDEEETARAETLFLQSLTLRETNFGGDSDAVLSMVYKIAAYYYYTAEFEKYRSWHQRYISAAEAKYGKDDKRLVAALRLSASFLITTNQENKADETINRIAALTGKPEPRPDLNNLLLRRAVSEPDTIIGVPPGNFRNSLNSRTPFNPYLSGARIVDVRDASGASYRAFRLPAITSADINNSQPDFAPRQLKSYGAVKVVFRVNEQGRVIEAIAETDNKRIKNKAAEKVMKYKFKPLVFENAPQTMRGMVWLTYFFYD